MKFKKGTRRKVIDYEKALVKYWQRNRIFEKSVELRPKDNAYVFYDGPPFITGVPHQGTLLSSIVKDAVPRYWTMKGKRVERVWGWDCHGLPAENYVEQKLGIKDKRDVYKIGLEKYILACRESMIQTGNAWEETINRIGRWVDFKGAYKTMDKDYMESVWWAFKSLYDAGKVYEGEKVLLYCSRCATPISKAEVAMDDSYQDVTDPSVYVKFKLSDEDVYLLAWTTTPWTLMANAALAINQASDYAKVEVNGQTLIMAKDLIDKVLIDDKQQALSYKLIGTLKGKQLVGRRYQPLFEDHGSKAHRIYHADYVSLEEGTGIVHIAPAYGEEDFELAQLEGIPIISKVDDNGLYTSGQWKGQLVWAVNKQIAKTLLDQGTVWKIEYIKHSYPHCHRCGTRLIYRAHPSWFLDISTQRKLMLEQNGAINWFPEHIKHGRFEKTLESAPDWNLSRDRFWATPMPVWRGKDNKGNLHTLVFGSYDELAKFSGVRLEDYHRPWIDTISFKHQGITYKRIDKVFDCWLESGSMPFAQFHYPFENVEKFESNFPGDFIAEYVGQVRAWFYYLHTISTALFAKNAFNNVIVTGTLTGNDGRKMSKSFNNFTDPNELMDTYSADALRFMLLNSPLLNGEDYSLTDKDVADVYRKLNMIWNMYDFFTLYAEVDKWEWDGTCVDPTSGVSNPLDLWIISRLHQLINNVDMYMQLYDIQSATKPILAFIDDASNWYVRRSRKRFWKSDNDTDKQNAYRTLHYVLVQLAKVMAPFTPFLSEELYIGLTGEDSVHLKDWPQSGHVNQLIIDEMAVVRELITLGLAKRAEAGIKVRQPLAKASLTAPFKTSGNENNALQAIITEELNIKVLSIKIGQELAIDIDTKITPDLEREGLARELIRHIQSFRKEAGLNVDDRIKLAIISDDPLVEQTASQFIDKINSEVLCTGELSQTDGTHSKGLSVDSHQLTIYFQKA